MGPLNQCPAGHLIMTLSWGPPVEHMVYRHLTSAGSPHRTVPSWSNQAGQSRNNWPPLIAGSGCVDGRSGLAAAGAAGMTWLLSSGW